MTFAGVQEQANSRLPLSVFFRSLMMLPRAAARVLSSRGAPITFQTLYPLIRSRTYAQDGRRPPTSDPPVPDPSSQSRKVGGNRIWTEDKTIQFPSPRRVANTQDSTPLRHTASKAANQKGLPKSQPEKPVEAEDISVTRSHQTLSDLQNHIDSLADEAENLSRDVNAKQPTSRSASELEDELQTLAQQNYISNQTLRELNELLAKKEAEGRPLPDLRFGIPSETAEPFDDETRSSQTTLPGSLPDLRQGIPTSFNTDSSETTASFKSRNATSSTLDLTEDPARGGGSKRSEGLPRDAYTTSIERRRLRFARYMYIILFGSIAGGIIYSGRNWDNEKEEAEHLDAPSGWGIMAFYARVKARLSSQVGFYTEPAFPKLLPNMDPSISRPYTLVLSLEDLLVHSEWSREHGWRLAKRPGVDYFLRYLSQYYELVIFTSVSMINADPIIRKLDPFQIVMWPLFREATRYVNGEHVKDLSYLNRDLSKTVIIDTNPAHVQFQPDNAVILSKWQGDPKSGNKNDLVALIPFLEYIAAMSITDVRKVIKSFEGKDIPIEFAAREAKAREAFNKQLAEEKSRRRFGGGLTSALGMKTGQGMMMPGEPSFQEGLSQGKMLSDQARERGIRNYQMLEKEIQENGQKWLDEMAREQKKAQEESMKAVQSGFSGFLGNITGVLGSSSSAGSGESNSSEGSR